MPQKPKVLVVGSGGREHALIWKLSQSPHQPRLYAAPGNPGMAERAELLPWPSGETAELIQLIKDYSIDLVVVGPEAPLAAGLVDACLAEGIRAFGPTQAGARLESSKAFAKGLMADAGIPTAASQTFVDAAIAKAYIRQQGAPIVVKADGLAAGKGVVVATTVAEAEAAVEDMLAGGRFGQAGSQVVIESFLRGREVSLMFFVDNKTAVAMIPARDYKRVQEGDMGPNTGGMGAIAPVPDVDAATLVDEVTWRIVQPLRKRLQALDIAYRGVLYVGLMLTAEGPYVVEYNCRFGDPETQVVLPLLDSDLLEVLWAVTADRLAELPLRWRQDTAVCVVLAAPGYPEQPRVGTEIQWPGADSMADSPLLFHAGTAWSLQASQRLLQTAGGRVMGAVGMAPDVENARRIAYALSDQIYFEGKHLRRDIGL
ncbi:phosphoribosylamine--glycine ligase [Alicyclobacillaceae bacterium I2511]|nr:phosphoribosylamine--glycine ligase [Alicyclobacillaceae bacterium I2511]